MASKYAKTQKKTTTSKSKKVSKNKVKSSKKTPKKVDKYWGSSKSKFSPSKRGVRECVLYNKDTKIAFKCQYNPTNLPRSRSAKYVDITSPGMAYPLTQFVGGESESMDIELFFYNREDSTRINNFEKFVDSLLPPKHNKKGFYRPPVFKFYYGKYSDDFVLVKKNLTEELLDIEGNPYSVKYTLTVRRV